MNNREAMEAGLLYNPGARDIMEEQGACLDRMFEYNHTRPSEGRKRMEMLREMLAECGAGCYVEPPFYANWAGKHIHFGERVYANFGFTCVDDGDIFVGDRVMFGPHVTLTTANHPIWPHPRDEGWQYNKTIRIEKNAWIGANVTILPGVTIGENAVIGAGAVVTKDIPANAVALGVPARVVRMIGEHDREYFFRDEKIDWALIEQLEKETSGD